jgi:uncharacterized low-complexity protein
MTDRDMKRALKPIAAAVGTAFVASLAMASVATADEATFGLNELEGGYDMLAKGDTEGKCGEGKCGEDKDSEGKCGEDKDSEGKCGGAV